MRQHLIAALAATTTALLALGTVATPATAAEAEPFGMITGKVTAAATGLPLDDIAVVGYQQHTQDGVTLWVPVVFAETGPTGDYVLYGSPGDYRVQFVECADPCTDPAYAPEFYNDVATITDAQTLTVTDNQIRPGVNAALAAGHLVSGTVTGPDAEKVTDGTVTAYTPDGSGWEASYSAKLRAGGTYAMVVPAGGYRVGFVGKGRHYAPEFHADSPTLAGAQTVTVGADRPGLDAQLDLVQVQNNQFVRPTVNGVPRVGSTLEATSGAWLPEPDPGTAYAYTYAWFRSGSAAPIGSGKTLLVPEAALGQTITVRVTATLEGYRPNTAESAPTSTIAAPATPLKSTAPPVISGIAKVGESVTVSAGTWEVTPSNLAYQWYADGKAIPGATGATLAITPGLLGARLLAAVSAAAPGTQPGIAYAAATPPVKAGTLRSLVAPMLTGKAKVGKKLKVLPGQTAPAFATAEIQWLVKGKPIAGATKRKLRLTKALQGAKVRAQVTYTVPGYAPLVLRTRATRVRS
ncbi:hypothetical protein ACJ5H2_05430 [Nocardioides sp. R1-1]|uniref:hypothetical protein n=1 Tax=Nocardioides sp. R1-1 TaxID=3383502 RepID=UPI0038D24FC9